MNEKFWSIPYRDLVHMFLYKHNQLQYNLSHNDMSHLNMWPIGRRWSPHKINDHRNEYDREMNTIVKWIQRQLLTQLKLISRFKPYISKKLFQIIDLKTVFRQKSFPKNIHVICVEKKKQFFKAFYQATEDQTS